MRVQQIRVPFRIQPRRDVLFCQYSMCRGYYRMFHGPLSNVWTVAILEQDHLA